MPTNEELENNFAEFMREELYGINGFYTQGGGAGRSRDYITSPEVGDLFGYVLASYIDDWYDNLEKDETAIVVEVGCGTGSLAASISRANMRNAANIDFRLVEISPVHRASAQEKLLEAEPEFSWSVHESFPACEQPTLVIANELLDNLVFNIGSTSEVYKEYVPDELKRTLLGMDTYAKFGMFKDIDNLRGANVSKNIEDFKIPIHVGIVEWMSEALHATINVQDLTFLLIDYMKPVEEMQDGNWLRLYSSNNRIVGVDNVLEALSNGEKGDITTDVTKQDLHILFDTEGFSRINFSTQKQWLERRGIENFCLPESSESNYDKLEELVKGNDESMRTLSFSRERNVLTDENGLGAFTFAYAHRAI